MPDPQGPTYRDLIAQEAKKARIPADLAFALVDQESGGQADITSEKGAKGFFQLMPATAKELGVDPKDPEQNIRGGLTYLRQQLDATNGDAAQALARYHGGPNLKLHGPKTQAYVQSIIGRLELGQQGIGAPPPQAAEEYMPAKPALPGAPGMTPGKPPDPSQFEWGTPRTLATEMVSQFDPRSTMGRRNIAGAAGSIAAGALVGGPPGAVVGGLRAATATVAGAAAGGMIAESGEQLVGTKPPSTTAVAGAGVQQGGYELAGHAFLWPVKAAGRRFIASKVGTAAAEGLSRARKATEATLDSALAGAQTAVKTARDAAAGLLRGTRREARQRTGAVETIAQREADVVAKRTTRGVEAAAKPYADLVGAPPSATEAGRAARAVIAGPSKNARDLVGQQVDDAARTGPAVDLGALKKEAQRILTEEIKPPQTTFPRKPIGDIEGDVLAQAGLSPAAMARQSPDTIATMQQAIAGAQAEAEQTLLKHPALGVINRILNAEDVVPFADAHKFKGELDDALRGTWDKAVKKRVESITQHLRTGLRGTLRGHAPYDAANAAYQAIIPLYTKGLEPQLRRMAVESPGRFVKLIKPDEPVMAQMFQDLLVKQAAEGGDAAAGQAAWDGVRSAWTHDRIIKGGIDQLADRIEKNTPPEFAQVMFGDESGQQILQNLKTIASAHKTALEQGARAEANQAAVGKAGVKATREIGRQEVERAQATAAEMVGKPISELQGARTARAAARKPTSAEERFKQSSIVPFTKEGAAALAGADILRVVGLGPTAIWGALSLLRLLHGPRGAELVEWAAFSSQNTQRLVQGLTQPWAGQGAADVLRGGASVVGQPPPQTPESSQVGTPPPR